MACETYLAQIVELPALPMSDIRSLYRELYGKPAPPRLGKDLVIRAIAHRIQEKALGGLKPAQRRRLTKLAQELANTGAVTSLARASTKPGTRLIREWRGEVHEVTVGEGGYLYRGNQYASLSRIAREITGTRWSGPAFFGLKGG